MPRFSSTAASLSCAANVHPSSVCVPDFCPLANVPLRNAHLASVICQRLLDSRPQILKMPLPHVQTPHLRGKILAKEKGVKPFCPTPSTIIKNTLPRTSSPPIHPSSAEKGRAGVQPPTQLSMTHRFDPPLCSAKFVQLKQCHHLFRHHLLT
jgi:hypothetical protein